jgi:IS30 family transposase
MSEEIRFHKSAIQWRRDIILQKLSQGYSQAEIARELQLHPSTISIDCQYLRQCAAQDMKNHIEERIPMRYAEVDTGLRILLRKAYGILNDPNSKTSEVLSAITSIANVYDKWLAIPTDEPTLNQAISWINKKKESLQKEQEQDQKEQSVDSEGSDQDSEGESEEPIGEQEDR